jgi:hypothetical protein
MVCSSLPSHTLSLTPLHRFPPSHPTWPKGEGNPPQPPCLSPSKLDHFDASHRARTRMQHAAACSTRQSRPSSLPCPSPSWHRGEPSATGHHLSPLLPPIKGHPRPCNLTHLTPLTFLEKPPSSFAHPVEPAGASRAPRAPRVPGDSEARLHRRLLKPSEKSHRRRPAPSPSSTTHPGEHPNPRLLPEVASLSRPRRDGEDHPGPSD